MFSRAGRLQPGSYIYLKYRTAGLDYNNWWERGNFCVSAERQYRLFKAQHNKLGTSCIMLSENVDLPRRRAAGAWESRYFPLGNANHDIGEAECRSSWAEEGLRTYREKILIVLERTWREKDYNCLWKDLIKRDYFIVTERTWWKETILWWLKGLGEKRPFVVVERTWGKDYC